MASCKVTAYDMGVDRVPLGMVQAVHKVWKFDDWQSHEPFKNWISFTSLLFHPEVKLIYCGLTSWKGDVFYAFDPKTKEFRSLEFPDIGDRFDVKIHRSLELDDDGKIDRAKLGAVVFGNKEKHVLFIVGDFYEISFVLARGGNDMAIEFFTEFFL
jgi:hypothetical protein